MNKKDLLEIKRRLKKDACTFTRMCGCYVDAEKNRVLTFGHTFLNLEEEEFYKYLEIARKVLSGTIGNHLLELEFPLAEEAPGKRQQFLAALKSSALKNEELLERFYDLVIDHYDYTGNYLILVFHDAYDVIKKSSDNSKLDESEEVYEYLLAAICPVSLSKAGLGYLAEENRIGARIRDWIVGAPESGFIFPAFTDRSADIHAVMTYHKNPKEPHGEFMEGALGCQPRRTAAEQKIAFTELVKKACGNNEETSRDVFNELQQGLLDLAERQPDPEEPVEITAETISGLMEESDIPEDTAAVIETSYQKEFTEDTPVLAHLMDVKAAEDGNRQKQKKDLVRKVAVLEEQLEDTRKLAGIQEDNAVPEKIKTYDVVLRVKPEKAAEIQSKVIDGKKCLVIPLEEHEHAAINGVNTTV